MVKTPRKQRGNFKRFYFSALSLCRRPLRTPRIVCSSDIYFKLKMGSYPSKDRDREIRDRSRSENMAFALRGFLSLTLSLHKYKFYFTSPLTIVQIAFLTKKKMQFSRSTLQANHAHCGLSIYSA